MKNKLEKEIKELKDKNKELKKNKKEFNNQPNY